MKIKANKEHCNVMKEEERNKIQIKYERNF